MAGKADLGKSIGSGEITPESVYVNRRNFMRAGVIAASAVATGYAYRRLNQAGGGAVNTARLSGLVTTRSTAGFRTDEPMTPLESVTHYNNFYEFSTDKEAVAREAKGFVARPWTVEVGGLVGKPKTFDLDEILNLSAPEERVYRMRCVEGWSMVVPWAGFSLSVLLNAVEPMSDAKYVAFQTLNDPTRFPGQQSSVLAWPYVEGLRMDEAMHPLALLTSGVYGQELPAQNGAPLRLITPWKYGFKGVKSIVKITLTDKEPPTTWNIANAGEYGFYANVNPQVDHPRWSQATEERLDAGGRRRIPTQMFNGYADQVASMYAGMDLRKNYYDNMRKPTFVSLLVWINGAVPAALLLNDAFHNRLGANPVKFALLTTGLLAIIFLTLSLSITPLRQIARWDLPFPARRTLGLWAAIYAFSHVGIFFWWDREASVSSTLHEIIERKYIWFGAVAVLIFIPLTLTSTTGMIRRLGPRNWKRLHRLVYVAAIGAATHYLLQGKFVQTQAIVFASIIGALLLYRFVHLQISLFRARAAKPSAGRGFAVVTKPKFWKGELKVVKTFDETPEVRTFRLAPIDGTTLPFDYKPGQYLNLTLTVDGKPVNRSYTIASSPTRDGYCELTAKREEMGTSSRHLHREVKVGDRIAISAPAGKFVFDGTTADSIVMIAGGVGITPLMSKIRYLTDLAWPGEIFLIFSTRAESDIIFRQELDFLVKRHPNLHVTVTLTRPADTWKGERGRVTPELLNRAVPNLTKRLVHICGPTAMADEMKAMLIHVGVPAEKIAMESFTSPKRSGSSDPMLDDVVESDDVADGPHELTFAKTGKTAEVPADQVVLEAAEAAGVPIDFDCRSGICGTCKVRLLSGRVKMDADDALTAGDRASGLILACQARCLNDVVIDA